VAKKNKIAKEAKLPTLFSFGIKKSKATLPGSTRNHDLIMVGPVSQVVSEDGNGELASNENQALSGCKRGRELKN
jgi:hypothetical protein